MDPKHTAHRGSQVKGTESDNLSPKSRYPKNRQRKFPQKLKRNAPNRNGMAIKKYVNI